jgi:hypothetical protein
MTMIGGGRIAEHLSIRLLARTYHRERIREILLRMDLQSKRVRDLPADALVYYGFVKAARTPSSPCGWVRMARTS